MESALTHATVERTVPAGQERVWKAFTDPADMAAWMWGTLGHNVEAAADGRVGGRYHVYTDAPEGEEDWGWSSPRWGFSGIYLEATPPERLVYTLHWDAPVGYNQTGDDVLDEAVIVTLQPEDGGTRITLLHVGIPDDGVSAAEHAKSIANMLDALESVL